MKCDVVHTVVAVSIVYTGFSFTGVNVRTTHCTCLQPITADDEDTLDRAAPNTLLRCPSRIYPQLSCFDIILDLWKERNCGGFSFCRGDFGSLAALYHSSFLVCHMLCDVGPRLLLMADDSFLSGVHWNEANMPDLRENAAISSLAFQCDGTTHHRGAAIIVVRLSSRSNACI